MTQAIQARSSVDTTRELPPGIALTSAAAIPLAPRIQDTLGAAGRPAPSLLALGPVRAPSFALTRDDSARAEAVMTDLSAVFDGTFGRAAALPNARSRMDMVNPENFLTELLKLGVHTIGDIQSEKAMAEAYKNLRQEQMIQAQAAMVEASNARAAAERAAAKSKKRKKKGFRKFLTPKILKIATVVFSAVMAIIPPLNVLVLVCMAAGALAGGIMGYQKGGWNGVVDGALTGAAIGAAVGSAAQVAGFMTQGATKTATGIAAKAATVARVTQSALAIGTAGVAAYEAYENYKLARLNGRADQWDLAAEGHKLLAAMAKDRIEDFQKLLELIQKTKNQTVDSVIAMLGAQGQTKANALRVLAG